MKISKRAFQAPESPIRKLIPLAEEAKRRGIHVYHLNIGQPDIETPRIFHEYIKKYNPNVVAYTHSAGLIELREAFKSYYKRYGIDVETDEIIVTQGGSEAILFSLAVIANPGDEVLVLEPFYANYAGFASFLGVKLVPVPTRPEDGYHVPDKTLFEERISGKTRAILFSNPSNPTGAVYSEDELKTIMDIALKYDLYVIADEVYREFVYDGLKHVSMMKMDAGERTIMVDSVSKKFSACGARIGVFVTKNKELYRSAMKFAQARLSPAMMEQYGVIGLLNLEDEYFENVRRIYSKRRDTVCEELSKIEGIVFKKPQGAFYISVKLPIDDAEEFVSWMLSDFDVDGKTTMVAPLKGFYATPNAGNSEIRIAFVLEESKLKDAVRILIRGLEKFSDIKSSLSRK